jgi:hypothetical protein
MPLSLLTPTLPIGLPAFFIPHTQSKKQGTSAEEKAIKLLGWFHSTKDFYSLKEIEKAGVKATGISGMIIKEWVLASFMS